MMAKKKNTGLGKGLDALFGDMEVVENTPAGKNNPAAKDADSIDIDRIKPNAGQPRKTFDEAGLADLAASIKEHGVIQPIIVRKKGKGYEIVAGERRWRASRLAGLKEVPCLVRELSDEELMLFAIIENMQREDLNPVEEAEGLDRMISAYGLTQEQVSRSVGKSRPYITNSIRLLKLPESIKDMIADGRLTSGHARALLGITDTKKQLAIARKIADEGLSVRTAEALAGNKKAAVKKALPRKKDEDVVQVESELKDILGTKVNLKQSGKRGRIEIEYYSRDELERLIELLKSL